MSAPNPSHIPWLLHDTSLHCLPCAAGVVLSISALMAVRLYAGKLWYCTDPAILDRATCFGTYIGPAGFLVARVWQQPNAHFDTFLRVRPGCLAIVRCVILVSVAAAQCAV